MNSSISIKKVLICDLFILVGIYLIPSLSHVLSIPMYILEPMRLAVLGCYLFMNDKTNAYIMAITLPVFSYLFAGHPVMIKCFIIGIELLANVYLLQLIQRKSNSIFTSVFLSILFSKCIYYLLKYSAISIGMMNMNLVDTKLWIQLVVAVLISISYVVFFNKKMS